ncbi:MBL fold metallo-hydrolase [Exiguobacterium antarcticum]|uniref:MBL fold metallo-hydrolase n=1 Tax=Exiguobacterium antarcticum TaxID=132920 RepID=A0ABT6R388_9BACL|nr:MBL fold metallo-hydrolase [Exiguobacterium antarcticum]AFS69503.1 Metallo-beta-lactamase family protein [Exiguobacterium antarcticum B7]MDI3235417.1 MBL fold metallo-hydrolase [Exiguobacterium antarcticum]
MQQFKQLTHRIWYQTPVSETDRPIVAVITGDDRSLVIDAGNSSQHAALFLDEMKKQGLKQPDLVALTHWHWDHIFGMKQMAVPTIATKRTVEEMQKMMDYEWSDEALEERIQQAIEIPFCADAIKLEFGANRDIEIVLPTIQFEGQLEVDLGGVQCLLRQVENDHSPESALIYIPQERVLFLGDAMYADIFSAKWNYTTDQTTRLLDVIAEYDADYYVWSHGEAMPKDEFEQEVTVLRRAIEVTQQASGQVSDMRRLYRERVERDLTTGEEETLVFFANGTKK